MSETCSTVDREKHNECKYSSMSETCSTVDREKHNECKYLSMSETCSTVDGKNITNVNIYLCP